MNTPPGKVAERVEERLALHEILRVGLARQEDLLLLQQLVQGHTELPAAAILQAFKECKFREEWRCMREAQLLSHIASMNLSSITDASMQLLTQQANQLRKMQQQQRSTRMSASQHPTLRSSLSLPHTPTSQQQSATPSVPGHSTAFSANHRAPKSSLPAALSLYTAAPGTPAGRKPASTAAAGAGALTVNPAATIKQTPATKLPGRILASNPVPASRRGPPPVLMTTEQLRRQLSLGAGAAGHTPPPGLPASHSTTGCAGPEAVTMLRPGSGGVRSSGTPGVSPATPTRAVGRSQSLPTTPLRAGQQSQHSGAVVGAPTQEAPRFQRLLRLQSTLLAGMQQHAEAGGPQAAVAALEESVALMQHHYQECMAEATRMADLGTTDAPNRCLAWSRLLPLAQLGLTPQDVDRLQAIRQHIAARKIQRAAHVFLRRVRHTRALAEATAKAQRAARRLREHAATVIQRYWRGCLARRQCAELRKQRKTERSVQCAQRVRMLCAATRIQRAWRAHRKRLKVQAAMAASRARFRGALAGSTGAAAVNEHKTVYSSQHEAAAGRIQAAVRGWLWRRSNQFWWAQRLQELRARRSSKAAWERQRAYLQASAHLRQQLVNNIAGEAHAREIIVQDVQQEQQRFEAHWLQWLAVQHTEALQQPLPRGWIPHRDPASGLDVFLDTRTGAIHAHHPAVLQLRAFAAAQREEAMAQLQERAEQASQRLERLEVVAAAERREIMAQLHQVMLQHLHRQGH